MEITDPTGDPGSIWYVTNGLLVMELVTGELQLGDDLFEPRQPAEVNVAGDADDMNGPTYATIGTLMANPALADGALITQRVDRSGTVTNDPALTGYGVTAAQRVQVPGLDHQVASVFWDFMNASGKVWVDGETVNQPLFESPYYATGYPIAEAYWTTVKVGGKPLDVLLQCFERRCLTYTPDNTEGWQVEAGNVGQHYYGWRYEQPEFEGQIAFASDRATGTDIYLANSTTQFNEPLRLTDHAAFVTTPAFSPNGERIVFASDHNGVSDLYVMDAAGGNETQLTFGLNATQPDWSPDGSQIAFVVIEDHIEIYVMDSDGSDITRLTTNLGSDVEPEWSADGERILFTSFRDENFELYEMDADGSNPRNLTDTPDVAEFAPAVSPDGTQIAYERFEGNANAEIYVMESDGSDAHNLTNHIAWDSAPAWSPDGKRIAFVSERMAGREDIYLMNADGSEQVNLTNHPGADLSPTWGP